MTKDQFVNTLMELYRVCNRADADTREAREDWLHPIMAGAGGCAAFDNVFFAMKEKGVLTSDEFQSIYDQL